MGNGQCQKNFLKAFREETAENIEGYSTYKRHNRETVQVGT